MKKLLALLVFGGLAFVMPPAMSIQKTNPDISVNILLLGKTPLGGERHEDERHERSTNRTTEHGTGKHSEKEHRAHKHILPTPIWDWPRKGERSEKKHGAHKHNEEEHKAHSHSMEKGFALQELEIYFKSNIDPYWRGSASLGISMHEGKLEMDLEEAFVESLFIPNTKFRAGRFYALIGRHNNFHSHHYPFIDPPLINQELFGFHGWRGAGASVAWLSPLPWYFEVLVQSFYDKEGWPNILFLKNFWDLNDSSTLELDLTYGREIKAFKSLYNASLIYKWKALSNSKKTSLSWTTEWIQAKGESSDHSKGGVYSSLQWQFGQNWWLQGRAEYLSKSSWKKIDGQKYSLLLGFVATEYSALRLQYDLIKKNHEEEWGHSIALQANMSMGTHPAHLY